LVECDRKGKHKNEEVDVKKANDKENEEKQKKTRNSRKNKIERPKPMDHSNETSQYAMEIKTVSGLTIKKIIDNISSLLKTVDIRFYPEGIYICAADLAKYVLISASLIAENFIKYYCPQRFKITLDIGALNNALSGVNSYGNLSFIFQKKESRNLILLMSTDGRRENRVTLYGMNSENKVFRVPKQRFENPMVFKSLEFQQDIRSMCYYSPMITFATNFKDFHMLASGEQGSSHLKLSCEKRPNKQETNPVYESVETNDAEMGEINEAEPIETEPTETELTETEQLDGPQNHPDSQNGEISETPNIEAAQNPESVDAENPEMNDTGNADSGDAGNGEVFDENVNGPIPLQASELDRKEDEIIIEKNLEKGQEYAEKNQGDVDKYMVNEDEDNTDTPIATQQSDETEEDLENLKFDDSYCSGLFILRYFHTICKNTNLGEYVEVMVKKDEFIAIRYEVDLGYLLFCVLECHPNK
jgi:hypothetical protein